MIIVLKKGATELEIEHVAERIKSLGLAVHISKGKERTIMGAIGDEEKLSALPLEAIPGVESVMPILKPYKLVSREFKEEASVVDVNGVRFGENEVVVIAGPCSVENRDSIVDAAKKVKAAGAKVLRGGA
ncbi:MAG: 3-deoxy-7-phosphoheptulonate synthase, partial [Deltaproteobacteria bacterium]